MMRLMGKAHLLVVSDRGDDIEFGKAAAAHGGFSFDHVVHPDVVKRILANVPNTMVLWNTGDEKIFKHTRREVIEALPKSRIFSLADHAATHYPYLDTFDLFSIHFMRRFLEPAPIVFATLAEFSSISNTPEFMRCFRETKKIQLTHSHHKPAAVEAVQKHLTKKGIRGRLAAHVAQSVDELLLNAIYDAPIDEKKRFMHGVSRTSKLEFKPGKSVELEFGANDDFMGVSVTDFYGSFEKESLLKTLKSKNLTGIQRMIESGLSLIYLLEAGKKTSATLIFPKSESYKEFREGFRFIGLMN